MKNHTVLLADDEVHITHILERKFQKAGFSVVVAGDGEEALEIARENPPDLVITDLQMPYMSGIELATHLRELPGTADTPVIMLTARGYLVSEEQLSRTNIRQIVSKPFSAKRILDEAIALIGSADASGLREDAA